MMPSKSGGVPSAQSIHPVTDAAAKELTASATDPTYAAYLTAPLLSSHRIHDHPKDAAQNQHVLCEVSLAAAARELLLTQPVAPERLRAV